jgi:hypothetical protein
MYTCCDRSVQLSVLFHDDAGHPRHPDPLDGLIAQVGRRKTIMPTGMAQRSTHTITRSIHPLSPVNTTPTPNILSISTTQHRLLVATLRGAAPFRRRILEHRQCAGASNPNLFPVTRLLLLDRPPSVEDKVACSAIFSCTTTSTTPYIQYRQRQLSLVSASFSYRLPTQTHVDCRRTVPTFLRIVSIDDA